MYVSCQSSQPYLAAVGRRRGATEEEGEGGASLMTFLLYTHSSTLNQQSLPGESEPAEGKRDQEREGREREIEREREVMRERKDR